MFAAENCHSVSWQPSETQQPGDQLHLQVVISSDNQPFSPKPFFASLCSVEEFRIAEYAQCQILIENSANVVVIIFVSHF